ncbi:hypothetical protein [Streptomyces sp. NPDC048516]|uniref:hypothetical protein n=1 Tax=Streptomyces sp. NPDC048516 TaxID=3365565 RepID=UPI003718C625
MTSQNPTAISHPNTPAPWGPYSLLLLALAALPVEQLQHLELVLRTAEAIGGLICMRLGVR